MNEHRVRIKVGRGGNREKMGHAAVSDRTFVGAKKSVSRRA